MHEYGYLKDDMLPLRKNTAKLLYEIGLPVKILNANNTDEKVPSLADILYRKEIHGIKKADWQEFLQSDKGYDYLYSRYFLKICRIWTDSTLTVYLTQSMKKKSD